MKKYNICIIIILFSFLNIYSQQNVDFIKKMTSIFKESYNVNGKLERNIINKEFDIISIDNKGVIIDLLLEKIIKKNV